MPFTFSHPGIVLPLSFLKRKLFSTSGLVAGSLAPDFEYFFRLSKGATTFSHTWGSLFYFNLPLSVVLVLLFHYWVRQPLVNHLPPLLYKRFHGYAALNWKAVLVQKWYLVVISIFVGSASHLLWDGLTHLSADYSYHHQHQLFFFNEWKHHSFIYTIVHLAHSFLGLVLVGIMVYRLPVSNSHPPYIHWYRYWWYVWLLCGILFGIFQFFFTQQGWDDVAVRLIAVFLLALLLVSIVFTSLQLNTNR
jgi:hypothetical protein